MRFFFSFFKFPQTLQTALGINILHCYPVEERLAVYFALRIYVQVYFFTILRKKKKKSIFTQFHFRNVLFVLADALNY